MDFNRLFNFLSIVQAGNITQAAKNLGVPKSKVSRDLSLLEKELGIHLVHRTTRQFRLSEEGEKIYAKSKEHLEALQQEINNVEQLKVELAGKIKVTAPEDVGRLILLEKIMSFKKLHPGIEFELIFTTQLLDLVSEDVDIAIRAGKLKDSSLKSRKLANLNFGLYCSKKFKKHSSIKLSNIEKQPFLSLGSRRRKNTISLFKDGKEIKIETKPDYFSNNFMVLADILKQGNHIALLPSFIAEHPKNKRDFLRVLPELSGPTGYLQALYAPKLEENKRVKLFRDYLVTEMQGLL